MCAKQAKEIIPLNNMTSFIIATNIYKFLSDGDLPMNLTTWIIMYLLLNLFRPLIKGPIKKKFNAPVCYKVSSLTQ